jgi:competence protein ComEC
MICEPSLICMSRLIEIAAAIPYGHQWLPAPPTWWVAVFYLAMATSMLFPPSRQSSLLRYGWILLWFPLAGWMATRPSKLPTDCLEATFVNVGHGTSAMLRFRDDEVWLYDCGRLGNETSSSRGIDSALWSMGITDITGIFLSHADTDHFNALPGLLRRFKVGAIYAPKNVLRSQQPALCTVRREVQHRGIDMIELASGSIAITSGYRMRVLHPPVAPVGGSDNANSLVLAICCGDKTLLLPGDLESPGTELLIRHERPDPGGVLMAPHHGSLSMDAVAVLQWARPSVAIVSGGRRAGRPEVERMLAQTGATVQVTSEDGAIRVRVDRAGQIAVSTWRETPW